MRCSTSRVTITSINKDVVIAGWRGAVIACLMASLSALLIVLVGFILVISMNKNAKPLAVLLLTAGM